MKKLVDNFDRIRELLTWENPGDYYYVQLILRKKDAATTFGNKNNSARLITTYQFFDIERFDLKRAEIIRLCESERCRAGINLNKRNEELITYELNCQLADRIRSKNFKGINGILNTANGAKINDEEEENELIFKGSTDKYWLLDCDSLEEYTVALRILNEVDLRPVGNKIIAVLPTYSGYHIITNRFDRQYFDNECRSILGKTVDIHKNNPVCLYYPEKDVEDETLSED